MQKLERGYSMVVLEQLKSASICRIFFSFKLIASSFSSFLFFFYELSFVGTILF